MITRHGTVKLSLYIFFLILAVTHVNSTWSRSRPNHILLYYFFSIGIVLCKLILFYINVCRPIRNNPIRIEKLVASM
jgi:hypothetical protein